MIRGKYRDRLQCEDGIFIGDKIVAVIDGVTSHGNLLWNGGSSGRFAKDVLCECLRHSVQQCGRRGMELWRLPVQDRRGAAL